MGIRLLMMLVLVIALYASIALVFADSISGPAGTAYYYYDGTYGTLDPSSATKCTMTATNIDISLLTAGGWSKAFHFVVQDRGSGSGWESI